MTKDKQGQTKRTKRKIGSNRIAKMTTEMQDKNARSKDNINRRKIKQHNYHNNDTNIVIVTTITSKEFKTKQQ